MNGAGTRRGAGDRRAELAARLAAVRRRIAVACAAAGRSPDEVTLVAVTKNFPASDVAALVELGVRDVAENKDQEARAKHAALHPVPAGATPSTDPSVDLPAGDPVGALRWHFVGQLQRNKVRSVVRYADVVHSVDRPALAEALGVAAGRLRDRPLDVLLQVDLSGATAPPEPSTLPGSPGRPESPGPPEPPEPPEPVERVGAASTRPGARGGADPRSLPALADAVVAHPLLRLRGLMAVAPLGGDPDVAFAALAGLAHELRSRYPTATWLSAGMSGDLEAAIANGATHVRVGSALLGNRTANQGTVTGE